MNTLTRGSLPAWLMAGSCLLLCCLGWTLLSTQFHYGQGHTERPITEFLLLYLGAWACFLLGLLFLKSGAERAPLFWILAVALLARIILLPSSLIQENDVYRYVLDGQALRHGTNPYQYSPLVVSDLAKEPLRGELQASEARKVLSRIGYPQISTIYPPAAQLAFAFGAWLGKWNWMGQRWTFFMLDLAVVGLLLYLLPLLQADRAWVLLYAWNPLVLKEVINSVHLDVLVAVFLLLLVVGLVRLQESGSRRWAGFSGFVLGMAVLSKLYPLLLLPACFFFLLRRAKRRGSVGAFLTVLAVTVILGFVPFLSVGIGQITAGLSMYAQEWVMNAGAFALLSALLPYPRIAAILLIASLAVLIPWFRQGRGVTSLIVDFQWVLLLWFLLLPAPFPWYALGLVALLPMCQTLPAPSMATVVLSGSAGLYYLSFFFEYHDYASAWWTAARGIEHAAVWIVLGLLLAYRSAERIGALGFEFVRNPFVLQQKGERKV